jgi:outer membrane protein
MRKSLLSLVGAFGCTHAIASGIGDVASLPETRTEAGTGLHGMLGIAALNQPEYIGSDNDETRAVPLININYNDIAYIKFNRAGVWFWKTPDTGVRFGAVIKPRRGWDDSDGSRLSGMNDRDDSIEAGLNLAWYFDHGELEFAYLTDVSDESDGDSAYINLAYTLVENPQWRLRGVVNLEYLDDDVTDYYWGVRQSEAIPGRPRYKPDDAWNTSAGLVATYSFSPSWALLGGAVYTVLGDDIEDSPIVEDDDYVTAFAGVAWTF